MNRNEDHRETHSSQQPIDNIIQHQPGYEDGYRERSFAQFNAFETGGTSVNYGALQYRCYEICCYFVCCGWLMHYLDNQYSGYTGHPRVFGQTQSLHTGTMHLGGLHLLASIFGQPDPIKDQEFIKIHWPGCDVWHALALLENQDRFNRASITREIFTSHKKKFLDHCDIIKTGLYRGATYRHHLKEQGLNLMESIAIGVSFVTAVIGATSTYLDQGQSNQEAIADLAFAQIIFGTVVMLLTKSLSHTHKKNDEASRRMDRVLQWFESSEKPALEERFDKIGERYILNHRPNEFLIKHALDAKHYVIAGRMGSFAESIAQALYTMRAEFSAESLNSSINRFFSGANEEDMPQSLLTFLAHELNRHIFLLSETSFVQNGHQHLVIFSPRALNRVDVESQTISRNNENDENSKENEEDAPRDDFSYIILYTKNQEVLSVAPRHFNPKFVLPPYNEHGHLPKFAALKRELETIQPMPKPGTYPTTIDDDLEDEEEHYVVVDSSIHH